MKKIIIFFAISASLYSCSSAPKSPETPAAPVVTPTAETTPTAEPAGRYKIGDELNVLAKAGIILREKPDAASAKIANIPYAGKVTIADAPGAAFQVEAFKGFNISGNWVKVTSSGKEGFVFDGFISKLSASKDDAFASVMKGAKSIKKENTNPSKTDKNSSVWMLETETFDNGVVDITEAYEGGSSMEIRMPESLISVTEAYLLTNAVETAKGTWSFDAKDGSLNFSSADQMEGIIIKKDGKNVSVEYQTAD